MPSLEKVYTSSVVSMVRSNKGLAVDRQALDKEGGKFGGSLDLEAMPTRQQLTRIISFFS